MKLLHWDVLRGKAPLDQCATIRRHPLSSAQQESPKTAVPLPATVALATSKKKTGGGAEEPGGTRDPSMTSAEEDVLQHKDGRLRVEVLPGGAFIEPLTGSESSFISVSGHPVLLLPITKTEPESVSSDETDVSDSQFEGVLHNSSFQEKANSACATTGGRREARHTEDIRALYCNYLKKEMENRDHQMAYRALKMRKIEKEMLLLDKQIM
ncbi:uncharacterized protein [Pseudochaenichthys georgianus]|uniref:uncharacterized protein n=1 Tax=Pseudochaenichthys georgianus TaxID=52239 RepID=UPI0039C34494